VITENYIKQCELKQDYDNILDRNLLINRFLHDVSKIYIEQIKTIMYEKYHKTWTGEKWVKANE